MGLETPMSVMTVGQHGSVQEDTWNVSSVIGLFEPGQQRRSFLRYIERERAVPYRPFVHYNDWYEVGITRNFKKDPNNRIANFELSNPEYFNAFVGRCADMVKNYDMRYFKFDGISTKFHAKGPGAQEDCEGIPNVLAALRKERPDIYLNTTVGTWASPFWFFHSDCVWRQENDFDHVGNMGDARDRWLTYRDRLVYEVFVEGAPLFPINSVMIHGTIITKNGPPRCMSQDPAKCTLTLSNSSANKKTLTNTLRQMLDVHPSVKGSIVLRSSFDDQRNLPGIMDTAVNVDTPISITLEPMEVIVMEGTPAR